MMHGCLHNFQPIGDGKKFLFIGVVEHGKTEHNMHGSAPVVVLLIGRGSESSQSGKQGFFDRLVREVPRDLELPWAAIRAAHVKVGSGKAMFFKGHKYKHVHRTRIGK